MKKDRNCGMNIPMYPYPMPSMMPGVPPMGMSYIDNTYNYPQNNSQNDLSSLKSQISSLERRISNLESLVGGNSTYNTSNYQML